MTGDRNSGDARPDAGDKASVLSRQEVSRKATAGVFFITSAGALLLVVGFVGSLILARLLTPDDFGIVALGMIAITLGITLADGGLAAAMIRRERPPTHAEFRSLTGLQLIITSILALVSIAVALNFGETGLIASVMIATLPLASFQTAGRVMIVKNLEFWRTSLIDAIAMLSFYVWSITAAALGAGAWSMATGIVVRSIVSTILVIALSPTGMVWPAIPKIRQLAPEIRFGVRFQLNGIVVAARDQLLNLVTATIAGVATLGHWSLATRLMQAPGLLFQSMWQVGYPAMAHLLAGKHDPRPILEEVTRLTTVGAALVLAPFAVAVPILITPVFGAQWDSVGDVVPLECLALLLVGPISVAATGYLDASNRPGDLVRTLSYGTVIILVVAAVLLPTLNIVALGIATVVNAVIEGVLLERYVRRACGARLLSQTVLPVAVGIAACLAALAFSRLFDPTILAAVATGLVALVLTTAGLAICCSADFRATVRLGRAGARNALSRRGNDPGPDDPEPLPETAPGLLLEP